MGITVYLVFSFLQDKVNKNRKKIRDNVIFSRFGNLNFRLIKDELLFNVKTVKNLSFLSYSNFIMKIMFNIISNVIVIVVIFIICIF